MTTKFHSSFSSVSYEDNNGKKTFSAFNQENNNGHIKATATTTKKGITTTKYYDNHLQLNSGNKRRLLGK